MKNAYKIITTLVMMLCLITPSVYAAGNIANTNILSMTSSRTAMIKHAKGQIRWAQVSVWSQGQVNESATKNMVEVSNFTNRDTLSILDLLKNEQVDFSVARPEVDPIYMGTYLQNADRYEMFYGYSKGMLENTPEGWSVPEDMLDVFLVLSSHIPIYIPNVIDAKLILRDEDDRIQNNVYLNVDDGKVWFETQYLGWNGDIAVTTYTPEEGYTTIMSTLRANGAEIPEVFVSRTPDMTIEGMLDYKNVQTLSGLDASFGSYQGHGDSYIIRFKTTAAKSLMIGISTSENVRPLGFWLENVMTGEVIYITYPQTGPNYFPLILDSGSVWEVLPDWDIFDNQEYRPWWWNRG